MPSSDTEVQLTSVTIKRALKSTPSLLSLLHYFCVYASIEIEKASLSKVVDAFAAFDCIDTAYEVLNDAVLTIYSEIVASGLKEVVLALHQGYSVLC